MMRLLPGILTSDEVRTCRDILASATWIDGGVTAGAQSARAKNNLQLPETSAESRAVGDIVLAALGRSAALVSAALPARVFPPLFNRYGQGMGFGDHIDNALRHSAITGAAYRTDLSCTLFLSDPEDYDGGELIIEDAFDSRRIKAAAGDLILYPATHVHRVTPVTRGERWASFFWIQSLVGDPTRRRLLHELDEAIAAARTDLGDDHPAAIRLTGTYHNLIRMWAEV